MKRFALMAMMSGMLVAAVALQAVAQETPGITVDKAKKSVTIACKVAPRKLPNLTEIYPLEVIATFAAPKGQKAHETVLTYDVKPSDIHKALESLGLKAGKPAKGEGGVPAGPELKVSLEIPADAGTKVIPIESVLADKKTGKPMPAIKWLFTGSAMKQPDPEKDDKVYGADMTGTLISIFPVTDDTMMQTSLTMKEEPLIKLDTNTKVLPAEGTAVKLILEVK